MGLRKRLLAILAVVCVLAGVVYVGESGMTVRREEEKKPLFDRKETIYFWYSDDTMTDYINSAAVSFGEMKDVRVIPVLASDSEFLEAINDASLHGEQIPDAYIISNDSLEKAYLAGLASEVGNAESIRSGEQFPPAAVSAVTYHDRIVGYPLFFETSALLYNETYLLEWARQQAQRELVGEDGEGVPDEALLKQKTGEYFESALPVTMDDVLNIADTFDAPEGVEGVM